MTTKLTIHIGKKSPVAATILRGVWGMFLIFSVPISNHIWFGGAWSLDLTGFIFGFMVAVAMSVDLTRTKTKTFETREEAAAWVAGWTE